MHCNAFVGPGPKARTSKRFLAAGFCFADSLGVLPLALSCDWQQKTKSTADDLKINATGKNIGAYASDTSDADGCFAGLALVALSLLLLKDACAVAP